MININHVALAKHPLIKQMAIDMFELHDHLNLCVVKDGIHHYGVFLCKECGAAFLVHEGQPIRKAERGCQLNLTVTEMDSIRGRYGRDTIERAKAIYHVADIFGHSRPDL